MERDIDQKEHLETVLRRFRKVGDQDVNASNYTDFDTSKPNFHDSKPEFLREKRIVEKALESANQLNRFLARSLGRDRPEDPNIEARVCAFADQHSRLRPRSRSVRSIDKLLRNNVSDAGLTFVLQFILVDLRSALRDRYRELETQENVYWSGSSRPPNHYARTIALRLARFVASETGQMPTIGTSPDGGHPSTEYGRALQEIFEILEVDGDFRRPGVWAIGELTEKDLLSEEPEPTEVLGSMSDERERPEF